MEGIDYSEHARTVIEERGIAKEWVERTVRAPDRTLLGPDGNLHCLKVISEREGRVLRVVVNARGEPGLVVTAFFDRRMRVPA
jgi:hypothetical protein